VTIGNDAGPLEASPQESRRTPLRGVRKLIAQRLTEAHATVPGVHVFDECDVTEHDLGTLLPVVVKAVADLAERFPIFNAHLVDDEVIEFSRPDVGIAVDTPTGLVVPVVRDCVSLSTTAIAAEIARLAALARAGRLQRGDILGGTVTVTSPGKRAGILSTPLINSPQTAIIGVYRATPRPVVRDGAVVVRTIANLSVTFDHRVVDGALAGDYAAALVRAIEAAAPIAR